MESFKGTLQLSITATQKAKHGGCPWLESANIARARFYTVLL